MAEHSYYDKNEFKQMISSLTIRLAQAEHLHVLRPAEKCKDSVQKKQLFFGRYFTLEKEENAQMLSSKVSYRECENAS